MLPETFRCYFVDKTGEDRIESAVDRRPLSELPAGDVLIEVACSSVNYKDAMAAKGHRGVVREFPHVPGIDAAGTVVESHAAGVQVGDEVFVTGHELGAERWGGWSEYVRVPSEWIIPLPRGLSFVDSMTLGTAGLTAGQCLLALQDHNVTPDAGEIVVTGATGGVGCLAVMLLARNGYTAVAVSGKPDRALWLQELGASRVLGRGEVQDDGKRPLLSARWAGAIDTVGGAMLASLLRSVSYRGCVAACGVVGGADVNTTVYPFILRGITLQGIDTAWCPMGRRRELWHLLAGEWKPESLDAVRQVIGLAELSDKVEQLISGTNVGRTVVDVRR